MPTTENYNGSDATGSDGGTNRVLTLSNVATTVNAGLEVHVSGSFLHITTDFTIDHNDTSSEITFLNALWDDQLISIIYGTTAIVLPSPDTSNDFETGPLNDLGINVTRTPVTTTESNIGGQKNYAEGDDETISVVFSNITKGYLVEESGETIKADALMFAQDDQDVVKHDKIVYAGNTYRVDSVSNRYFNGTHLFKRAILFLISA